MYVHRCSYDTCYLKSSKSGTLKVMKGSQIGKRERERGSEKEGESWRMEGGIFGGKKFGAVKETKQIGNFLDGFPRTFFQKHNIAPTRRLISKQAAELKTIRSSCHLSNGQCVTCGEMKSETSDTKW